MADDNEHEAPDEENVYEEDEREELVASDEISAEEDTFMKGYEEHKDKKEDEVL